METKNVSTLPAFEPNLGLNPFLGPLVTQLKRKENSSTSFGKRRRHTKSVATSHNNNGSLILK
jgi:hypothetical protein